MRISDWSSDVCSSDLTSTEANFLRVEGAAADANPTNIEVANCRDKTPGSSPSVRVKGNAKVLDRQNNFVAAFTSRSEERRVGKECVSACRSRWSQHHIKKKNQLSS